MTDAESALAALLGSLPGEPMPPEVWARLQHTLDALAGRSAAGALDVLPLDDTDELKLPPTTTMNEFEAAVEASRFSERDGDAPAG